MSSPKLVRAKVAVFVDADLVLDRDGNVEEVVEIHEVFEALEVDSITNVKSTY